MHYADHVAAFHANEARFWLNYGLDISAPRPYLRAYVRLMFLRHLRLCRALRGLV